MSNGRYSLMGPTILITIGTLFLIHEWIPNYHFGRLWPVILIVIGVVRIMEAGGIGRSEAPPPAISPAGNPPGTPGGAPPPASPAGTSGA